MICCDPICNILNPGDESVEGKTLRLKEQYTLCSVSLQDIIAHFERRSGKPVKWENFPDKIALQMNDKDFDRLEGFEPEGSMGYYYSEVLPNRGFAFMWLPVVQLFQELLPRHVEITMMIDGADSCHSCVKLESSAVNSVEEVEVADEETESINEEQPEQ
ncbi:hypothetical protein SADUNF_Sadunf08G0075200 [Salix dunnii]|uniref:Alpha-1,4 glucan phosphorylase n=1 Tax=Salix dunnii TaxID=1413687 RepID=A0A835JZP8_9ROSI|nr:hypothetical protein SADUNF_Sadunf08G0075200 [Salix dunnii]